CGFPIQCKSANHTERGCEQGDQEDFDSEAKNFNIALDGVSVTSLSFGKEFTHAIEAEQVAAHQAEHAKFIVEKAEQDKKSAIVLYALLTVSVIVTTTDRLKLPGRSPIPSQAPTTRVRLRVQSSLVRPSPTTLLLSRSDRLKLPGRSLIPSQATTTRCSSTRATCCLGSGH
uniref:Prohibitin n=1 Tax=Aegilops tauschii subsp. strangulata TaxID=200361 RepID=A0A453MFY8_AEGTS